MNGLIGLAGNHPGSTRQWNPQWPGGRFFPISLQGSRAKVPGGEQRGEGSGDWAKLAFGDRHLAGTKDKGREPRWFQGSPGLDLAGLNSAFTFAPLLSGSEAR